MSTISTTINHGITLGSGGYTSPLTITSAGYVDTSGVKYGAIVANYGTVANFGMVSATALSNGAFDYYGIQASEGMLTNTGTIETNGFAAVRSFNETIRNSAQIVGGGVGVFADQGLVLTNSGTGTISGTQWGIYARNGEATITNSAVVAGAIGVEVEAGGAVANTGTITGTSGAGIQLDGGGAVTNGASGSSVALISGAVDGVSISGAAGTVTNYGGIEGNSSTGAGVVLSLGGSVTNQSGGTITGYFGIYAGFGPSTVTNAGVIDGVADAAKFAAGYTNLLVIDPGAVFAGTVTGGNTIGAASISTLELASGASGGTLTGFGTQYVDFARITIDAAASWTLTGANYLDGATLTDAGTLTNTGSLDGAVTLDASAVLTNASGGTISTSTRMAVYGAADGAATVVNAGLIASTEPLSGYGVSLAGGGTVTNQLGATISGYDGVSGGAGGPLTVTNDGNIVAGAPHASHGAGVLLGGGGYVTNQSDGTIIGHYGIYAHADPATVVNYGAIVGYKAAAVELYAGGSVTNLSSGTINGYYVGVYAGGSATVVNAGIITAANYAGVELRVGGSVTNLSGGTISGYYGVYANYSVTVVNAGVISASSYAGVGLNGGGSVTNLSGGTISGYYGVYAGGSATVVNAGTISGSNKYAVEFAAGYTNQLIVDPGAVFVGMVNGNNPLGGISISTLELAAATGDGTITSLGVQFVDFAQTKIDAAASWTLIGANYFATGTTLTNAGTLTVSNTTVVDAGSVINDGSIVMDPSTLTLADLTGTGEVFIGADGTLVTQGTVSGGETIDFASRSGWLALTPADFSGEIAGFFSGDTIDLTGITDATAASIVNGNTLRVEDGGTPILLTLDPSEDYTGVTFTVGTDSSPNHYNTITTDLACFAEGTRLDTPGGPVAVEALRAGDFVLTLCGPPRKVRWVGWRRLVLHRHPDPAAVQPVRVLANAVAAGEPRRDVRLSPSHALLVDGMLIPVGRLVNGATIRREDCCRSVTYFHVELDTHDVLLAEGLAAESYLDTGNRGMFENADAPLVLHPELGAHNDQAWREAGSCAPFVAGAGVVEPVWHALAERARTLGHGLAEAVTTDDPALRLQVDGKVLLPVAVRDGCHVFVLPEATGSTRLVSRATSPDALRPWVGDSRSLGVSVRRLTVRHGDGVEVIPLDHPCLRDGWWALERDGARHARWTNGNAELPLALRGPAILEVEIAALDAYLVTETVAEPELQTARQA